ncbi:uncharacterized protein BDR25DRAFT_396358 [Lindgomyces ingoldianus]|uniref:Uncharacterized protein n=1 Tax=Lindgomyces ingoldianus TaxID=673940 RepID=A0ACB6QE24_9PLEO|nr:uncharacterized protein BDR25DRAFT_396358 [Lindgomyces ingoldianus]KAF2465146.1 hypothetical protein BDR25DRAFT_396358 [Lindgomyces ingoldianus]
MASAWRWQTCSHSSMLSPVSVQLQKSPYDFGTMFSAQSARTKNDERLRPRMSGNKDGPGLAVTSASDVNGLTGSTPPTGVKCTQHSIVPSLIDLSATSAAPTMDHWGDPWADNGDTTSPQKDEIKTPLPLPTGAVLLGGFIDDAQWGSSEHDEPLEVVRRDGMDDGGWGSLAEEQENIVSEASDSATTIQPDDIPDLSSHDFPGVPKVDDDLSTRPSTSPSDVSQTDAPVESPRTSFEDERRTFIPEDYEEKAKEPDACCPVLGSSANGSSEDDDFGEFEDDHHENNEPPWKDEIPSRDSSEIPKQAYLGHVRDSLQDTLPKRAVIETPAFIAPDSELFLVAQLFPPPKPREELPTTPDDPISTTSARKAWYRLTRKQTMREFNSGNDDDNYVRVTWETSHIRSEVTKIVGRWASEDLISGRGQAGGAGFNWDHRPSPTPNMTSIHPYKKSSIPTTSPIRPTKQVVQPFSTNVPAASFSWSSTPSASQDPSQQRNPSVRSTSSPFASKRIPEARAQGHEVRSVSVDLTNRGPQQPYHRRTATSFPFAATKTNAPKPPLPAGQASSILIGDTPIPGTRVVTEQPAVSFRNPKPSMDAVSLHDIDHLENKSKLAPVATDDEDDWGEMVESPATSIPPPLPENEPAGNPPESTSTPSTTPKATRPSPSQPPSSRHASPIVRLKSTVSPTSARFGFQGLPPQTTEIGPIGPQLLKPVSKSANSTPEKTRARPRASSKSEELEYQKPAPPNFYTSESDGFSDFESSVPPPMNLETPPSPVASTPPPPPPPPPPNEHLPSDPFSEADFSLFESTLPTTTVTLTGPRALDPSDPFSIFESAPPIPNIPSAPFTRPLPQPVTPPPKLPLTGASNSAQRRKAEEDEIVRTIVNGLPDLGYMLKR